MVARSSLLSLMLIVYAIPVYAQNAKMPLTPRDIAVETRVIPHFLPTSPEVTRFGKLTFLGGLELKSKDPDFGGLSGLVIEPDGKNFIAITDRSHWITGTFTAREEKLTGVETLRIAPMLAPNGRRLRESRYYDTEGLAWAGRSLLVSVERNHAILRYDWALQGFAARPTLLPPIENGIKLDKNAGIEAIGIIPAPSTYAGTIIALAEQASGETGADSPGFLIGGKTPASLSLKSRDNFAITDLNFLPNGDMLVLERRYTFFSGVAMRIRRIPLEKIAPNAVLDGETLIEVDLRYDIDNMEALAIHTAQDGSTILTLVSDDNFSSLQRSLVLRFALEQKGLEQKKLP